MAFIRSIKHSLKFSNKDKLEKIDKFLIEYQRIGQSLIDEIWKNGFFWKPTGFFNFDGSELIVPVSDKKNNFL